MATFDPGALPRLLPKIQSDQLATAALLDKAAELGMSLIAAVLILLVTLWASKWLSRLAHNALARVQARHGGDVALQAFVSSMVRYLVIIVGLIAVLQQLGIKTTSILAVLGAASLAVGLAMQGALSNVAAGVMLLILRPYRAGDLVEVSGQRGTVVALDLFTTELITLDGLKVIMPNGKVFGEMITNYSAPETRRMEITIGIDYDDDIDKALGIMLATANADERVLDTPEPWARCVGLGDSSVNVALRVWATQDNFWDLYHDLIKRLKQAFDAEGISIPFPHQVHVEKAAKPTVEHKKPPAPPEKPRGDTKDQSEPA
jgi:small conductance mechanosensitive channel